MRLVRPVAHARNLARFATGGRASRRELVRVYGFRVSRALTPVVLAEAGDMRFLVSTHDDVVGRKLFASGAFDLEPMEAIMRELAQRAPEALERGLFVDVGANIGTTSVAAVVRFGMRHVVAVEPDPENFGLLELNLCLNGLADRSRAHRFAASDAPGDLRLLRSAQNSGDHRAVGDDYVVQQDAEVISVPATTLDALLEADAIDPADVAVLWIDAQGHEGHVLAGASSLLARSTPVVLEFWPQALRAAGGLDRLVQIVQQHFDTIVDMGPPYARRRRPPEVLSARDVERLVARYSGERFADLILLG